MYLRIVPLIAAGALLAGPALWGADPAAVGRLFDGPIASAERDMVPLAEAMPAGKFDFAPTEGQFKGVRTFAGQIKHVAAVNYMVAAAALQETPPVDIGTGEKGPDSVKTKDQIVAFLKGSFEYAHKAAKALNEKNQLEMVKSPFGQGEMARAAAVSIAAWHTFDHYGQMVVYARMNGIVPPASR